MALLSAGIGATPVLAMLHAMSSAHSTRPVLWLHAARDGKHFPFAAEVRRLVSDLPHGRSYVSFSRPEAADRLGTDFDAEGHLSRAVVRQGRPDAGRRRLPVWADPLHGGHESGAGGVRRQAGPHSQRDLQRRRRADAGRRRRGDEDSASAARSTSKPAPSSRSRAAASPPTGIRRPTEACWNWPRRATSRCAGHAGPGSATAARAASSRERSPTSLSRSTCRRRATCSSAVRARSGDVVVDL